MPGIPRNHEINGSPQPFISGAFWNRLPHTSLSHHFLHFLPLMLFYSKPNAVRIQGEILEKNEEKLIFPHFSAFVTARYHRGILPVEQLPIFFLFIHYTLKRNKITSPSLPHTLFLPCSTDLFSCSGIRTGLQKVFIVDNFCLDKSSQSRYGSFRLPAVPLFPTLIVHARVSSSPAVR